MSFWLSEQTGFCPPLSEDILSSHPTVKRLKEAVKFLEKKYEQKVDISRWDGDGKNLPPTKHDLLMAVSNFRPSLLPIDMLITVLSYSPFPMYMRLLSKEIAHHANNEEFYWRVCCNFGYERTKVRSYRTFFLDYIDIRKDRVSYDINRMVCLTRDGHVCKRLYFLQDFLPLAKYDTKLWQSTGQHSST